MLAVERRSSALALIPLLSAILLAAALAGCGGGSTPAPQPTAQGTVDAAGGTIGEPGGAAVVVPAGAIVEPVTIAVTEDAAVAPALPEGVEAKGSVYAITPHGRLFGRPVTVRLPVPGVALQPGQEWRIAKAEAGEDGAATGPWELLGGVSESGGVLSAETAGFSYFAPVVITPTPGTTEPMMAVTGFEVRCDGVGFGGGPRHEQWICGEVRPDHPDVEFKVSTAGSRLPSFCVPGTGRVVAGANATFFARLVDAELIGGVWNATDRDVMEWPAAAQPLYARIGLSCASLARPGEPEVFDLREYLIGVWPEIWPRTELRGFFLPAETLAVEGREVSVMGVFSGGCMHLRPDAFGPSYFCSSTDQAFIEWERSDDAGSSWRPIARSYQGEASADPFSNIFVQTKYWGVTHHFHATAVDDGALLRARACYDPPDGSRTRCAWTSATRLVVVPESARPSFTAVPVSVLVRAGQPATFTAAASGTPAPTLRWQTRPANSTGAWADVTTGTGATTGSYTTAPLTLADNGVQCRVVATSAVGTAESPAVTASVSELDVAPEITTQPAGLSVAAGGDAVFAVVARGTEALAYQWRLDGAPIPGATSPVLRLAAVGTAQAGGYSVVVTNAAGAATSATATLTVTTGAPQPTAPTIVTQPAAAQVGAGNTATFAVGVAGTGPFTYQWRKDGAPVAGATLAYFTIPAVVAADAGTYSVVVSSAAGQVTSAGAVLTVLAPAPAVAPAITTQPAPQVQPPGGAATFAVAASGTGPLTYQWTKGGAPIPGATGPVLLLANLSAADEGSYAVTVSNAAGQVTSAGATLTVLGAPVIVAQPAAATVTEGATASFEVVASGAALRYQWLRNGLLVDGATSAKLVTPALTLADGGAVYAVIVSNAAGIILSQGAALTVDAAPPPAPTPITGKVSAAYQHTCAVTAAGQAACWGYNGAGQIGRGDLRDQPTPYTWTLPEAVTAVAAGHLASCALTASGAVWCAGSAAGGARVPTQVGSFTGVRQLTLGRLHACLLTANGEVACWGDNSAYQLGTGGTTASSTPVTLQGPFGPLAAEIVEVDAGDWHTCARTSGGEVLCWGDNGFSRAGGIGVAAVPFAAPVEGAGVTSQLALGETFSCALGSDTSVRCWGLAFDAASASSAAAEVAGLPATASLGVGSAMACAIDDLGRVRCWGTGVMGNGNVNQTQPSPGLVSGLTGVLEVAGGGGHTCALRADGTLACWGSNGAYQLGTGDLAPRTTPEDVVLAGGFWRP